MSDKEAQKQIEREKKKEQEKLLFSKFCKTCERVTKFKDYKCQTCGTES